MNAREAGGEEVLLDVRVQPKASRNEIVLEEDGRIRVALTAPPVDGAANKALRTLVARELGLPKSAVTLYRGGKSRDKTLAVKGLSAAAIKMKLAGPS